MSTTTVSTYSIWICDGNRTPFLDGVIPEGEGWELESSGLSWEDAHDEINK